MVVFFNFLWLILLIAFSISLVLTIMKIVRKERVKKTFIITICLFLGIFISIMCIGSSSSENDANKVVNITIFSF